jgi:hypothetical protein
LPVALLGKRDGAGEGTVVRERNRGHLELRCTGRERGDSTSTVEDRVLGVDVEVDERSLGHGHSIIETPVDAGRTA